MYKLSSLQEGTKLSRMLALKLELLVKREDNNQVLYDKFTEFPR